MKNIITISRQCGSGGHTIAQKIAEKLGVPLYDKKLIKIVSERSGLSKEVIEKEGEYSTTSFLFNIATHGTYPYDLSDRSLMPLPDQINAYQTELIKEIVEKGSCVIVGRSADYILKDRDDCLNIFIHGNLQDRVQRIIDEHSVEAKEAEAHVLRRDKKRSKYYEHITDQKWGLAENYHLCLDSSLLGVDGCVQIVLDVLNRENNTDTQRSE